MLAKNQEGAAPVENTTGSSRLDWWLIVTVFFLIGCGLLMIYSASALYAEQKFGNSLHFTYRQGAGVCAGLVAVVILQLVPLESFRKYFLWLYVLGLIGLCLVFTPLGHAAYGSSRWISLGGINVQPSEFAKIALILVMAQYLSNNEGRLGDVAGVVIPALFIPIPVIGLLMLEPDFGTTVVTVALAGVMLFIAGLKWRYVFTFGSIVGGMLGFLAVLAPYRMRRLTSFWDPYLDAEGNGYQVIQGWIAMASGGWTGQGLASGVAKRGGLPEAHNDFISAVLAEELGGMGWIVLVCMYLILIWRGYSIATRAKNLFGTLVAGAVTTILAAQVVINLGVVVGWMPAKGLVLPFMSYGASAVVAHLICVGLLLKISTESQMGRIGYDAIREDSAA